MVVKTDLAEGSGNTLDVSLVKKKSRKGKEVSTNDAVAEVDVVEKKEKKKRKKAAKDEAEKGDKSVEDIDQGKPKKRSKHREQTTSEEPGIEAAEEDVKKHKKKRKHRDETANDHTGTEATEDDTKSHRKKKRKHSDPEGTTAEPDEDSNSVDVKESGKKHKKSKKDDKSIEASDKSKKEKKKKRKHSEHGFKDPSSDELLSEQANKALSYAYAQVDTPSSWKFNKARQNWLIRNVLSEEAIPDDYVPLVNRYLSGVQGGAREALVKSCQAVIAGQSEADDANPPSQVDGSEEKPTAASKVSFADTAKEQRARDLVQLLTQNVTEFE
ncbi:hypothetical protein BC629DRAFT_1529151 [Irpex lacteus]|nr:hypothetical protein BC629DRAFT_1529151 [Irpex lacteus]